MQDRVGPDLVDGIVGVAHISQIDFLPIQGQRNAARFLPNEATYESRCSC